MADQRRAIVSKAEDQWWYWKQRAKCKWDAFGDQSSKFFFKSVKGRAQRNDIRGIKAQNGAWISDAGEIKQAFKSHFQSILQNSAQYPSSIDQEWIRGLTPLSDSHISMLLTSFSNAEIKKAAFSSKPLKSPGPDGVPQSLSRSIGAWWGRISVMSFIHFSNRVPS